MDSGEPRCSKTGTEGVLIPAADVLAKRPRLYWSVRQGRLVPPGLGAGGRKARGANKLTRKRSYPYSQLWRAGGAWMRHRVGGCARGGGQLKALVQAVGLAVQRRRPAASRGYLIHGRDKTLEPFPILVQVVTHAFPVPGVVE